MDPQPELLQRGAIRLLTSGFAISPADVNSDARRVLAWSGPNDDLLASIAKRYEGYAGKVGRWLNSRRYVAGLSPGGFPSGAWCPTRHSCVIRAKTDGRFGMSRTRKTAEAVHPKRLKTYSSFG